MRLKALSILVAAISLAITSFASNARGRTQSSRAGLDYALAHHIPVTAAAAKQMVLYPVGSCPNDPFQEKCEVDGQTKYLFDVSDLAHPSPVLRRFIRRHGGVNALKTCNTEVTELHATYDQEIAHGHQRCWRGTAWQCAWLDLQLKVQNKYWKRVATSIPDNGHGQVPCKSNGLIDGGDGTINSSTWDWCAYFGSRDWRWWRAYEHGTFNSGGGTQYANPQLVHHGCVGSIPSATGHRHEFSSHAQDGLHRRE